MIIKVKHINEILSWDNKNSGYQSNKNPGNPGINNMNK